LSGLQSDVPTPVNDREVTRAASRRNLAEKGKSPEEIEGNSRETKMEMTEFC
jgi:hypothetical protein